MPSRKFFRLAVMTLCIIGLNGCDPNKLINNFFSDLGLNCLEVCSRDTCVGDGIDFAAGNRCVWGHPRARIGFARVLDICDSRDGPDCSVLDVAIGVVFDRTGRCVVSRSIYCLFLWIRRRRPARS